jgi:osmotically-inducible protein OsmY
MKRNEDLQKDVQDAIKWEPLLHAAEIGVIAKDGIITLTGLVDSYAKKLEAEHATRNVAGVKGVVEQIEIHYSGVGNKTDNEIATEALNALKWNWELPNDKVMVKVEKGWITLDGELEWHYQKETAQKVVKNIAGVRGVANNIKIKSEIRDKVEQKDIERALVRNWSIEDKDIQVKVVGSNVTLNGSVASLYQKNEAGRIAWNAPGVHTVDNEIVVEYLN